MSGIFVWELFLDDYHLVVFAFFVTTGADLEASTIWKRGPLKIWVFAVFPSWIVFGSSNTVGVSANNLGSFIA